MQVFTKLKRKAKETEKIPQSPAEPNLIELGQSAMNSYRLRTEVVKTDNGFEVV